MKNLLLIPFFTVLLLFSSILRSDSLSSEVVSSEVVRVVTSGGFAAAYNILEPEFETLTGIDLQTEYGSSSGGAQDSIPSRLARGEEFDVIILSEKSLNRLTAQGAVQADARTDLVRSTIGMAVKSGAKKPDIRTKEAFAQTLMHAESIGYSASASGTYLSTVLWPQMGIWQQIKGKSKRILSERVASVVARGEVEIGFQQISEILPIAGVEFAGPIPQAVQKVTTFSTGIATRAKNVSGARRLIDFLSSKTVAATIASTGLIPVVSEFSKSSEPTLVPLSSTAEAEKNRSSQAVSDFPNKPLTMVVGFGVGGSADRMTRAMSSYLAEELGQPIKVINKKGAGTLLASKYVLAQPHDGYTLYSSAFSPYLTNSILEGNADFTINDFAYLNFQWFDEDLIALSKHSEFNSLLALLEAIRNQPKTIKASVVRGSAGHLMAKILLEVNDIPQENLNLVAYNNGGLARAAVAGGVVDFIVISAKGSEGIREYLKPLAICSDQASEAWGVPTLNQLLAEIDIEAPVLPGSIRGYGVSAASLKNYPNRFKQIAAAMERTLQNPELQKLLDQSDIGFRWVGPEQSNKIMQTNFEVFKNYSYLLELK